MHKIIERTILLSILLLIILPTLGSAMPDEGRFNYEGKPRPLQKERPIDKIKFPLSSLPVIVKQGDSFSIRVDLSPLDEENLNVDKWKAWISTAYDEFVESYNLSIESIEAKGKLFTLEVRVPKNTAIDLYNLTVGARIDEREIEDSHPRAVSVVSEIKDNFTFIQVTDPHCWDLRTWLMSPGKYLFGDKWENFTKSEAYNETIREVNLIHPDFVLLTGDFIGGPFPINIPSLKRLENQYKTAYNLLQRFDVPTYLIPGNHDGYAHGYFFGEDGLKLYEKYFGDYFYSFNYSGAHFTMLNSYDWPFLRRWFLNGLFNPGGKIRKNQFDWIEKDLANAQESNLRFVCLHHDSLERGFYGFRGKKPFVDLISEANVTMILAGHVHRDSKRVINDTLFLTTTSCACSLGYLHPPAPSIPLLGSFVLILPREEPNPLGYDQYWGFRQVIVEDSKIKSYAYGEGGKSIPTYRLSVNYNENREKASIKSELKIPLKVKVDLHTKDKDYRIIGGELLWKREVSGIKILTCKVETPPNSLIEVEVVGVAPLPKPVPLVLYLSILLPVIAIALLVYYLLKVRRKKEETS